MSIKKSSWIRPEHAAGCLVLALMLHSPSGLAEDRPSDSGHELLALAGSPVRSLRATPEVDETLIASRAEIARKDDTATLSLDFPAQVKYAILMLHKPNRLVIELSDPVGGPQLDRLIAQLSGSDPDISRAYVDHPSPAMTHIVFVFKQMVPIVDAVAEIVGRGRQRLVLTWSSTIAAADHADAAVAAGQPEKAAPPRPAIAPPGGFTELLLTVEINRQPTTEPALLVSDKHGDLYASADEFKRWRLSPPAIKPVRHQDVDYYALKGYEGLQYEFNDAKQTISMMAEARLFPQSTVPVPIRPPAKPTPSKPGGFLNYDFVATHSAGATQRSGQFELGLFNGSGVCTSGAVAPQIGAGVGLIRLDTTCSADAPEQRQSWRFGDVASRAGASGGAVRMGGVQFGTNFGTQPGFINFPVQQASGVASLPSAVDVYVNNVLTSRREVPPGPFSITNLPVVSGNGEVRLVVRDMLGREQVVTQPFYTSAGLLAPGLHDYSYEYGFVRENFGTHSNDYGGWAAAATHRKGFTDNFTGEAHLEMQSGFRAAAVNGVYLVPSFGMLSTSLATSQANGVRGALGALGFERQDQPVSFATRAQWTNSDYTVLGQAPGQPSPARQLSMNLGYSLRELGSLGFSHLLRDVRDQGRAAVTTASYNVSTRRSGTLMLSLIHVAGTENTNRLSLVWAMPLGINRSASVTQNFMNGTNQAKSSELVGTLEKTLSVGEGDGYRIEAKDWKNVRGEYSYQNNVGTYGVAAEHIDHQFSTRASVRGGLARLGGETFFSRWIDSSFGIARVPGFPNVRVYADNHLVGQTDANGDAMLPRLRAYERNQIRIEPRDLPINAQVDALRLEAVPYYRSGVVADFPVRRSKGALFRVRLENGEALPLGSAIRIGENGTVFPVAFNGEVFITGLSAHNLMIARWQDKTCGFDVDYVETDEPVPDLGAFICKENSK